MFGFGKKKVLDEDLMYQNVVDTILDMLVDTKSLDFHKFISMTPFDSVMIDKGGDVADVFYREKLILLCSFATIVIQKNTEFDDISGRLVVAVKSAMTGDGFKRTDFQFGKMQGKIDDYAGHRLDGKAGGRWVEANFAKNVFGVTCSQENVDANYLLYKSLSRLEFATIRHIARAINKSLV